MTYVHLLRRLRLAPAEEQIARLLIGSLWPGAEWFTKGHAAFLRSELRKRRKV